LNSLLDSRKNKTVLNQALEKTLEKKAAQTAFRGTFQNFVNKCDLVF
jgi:hypothetical protein